MDNQCRHVWAPLIPKYVRGTCASLGNKPPTVHHIEKACLLCGKVER